MQITAVLDIAKAAKTPRVLRGHSIISPTGNAELAVEDEKELRRKYIYRAIEMLQGPGQPGVAVEV